MTNEIYLFSGLGADESVFQRLDFSNYSTTFIKWIAPLDQETIEHYATRLIEQIPTAKPILIGLSFGGIMAIEVAKQIDTAKVILIASAKTKKEIPFYYRIAGRIGLHKLLPARLLKSSNAVTDWFFGAKSSFDKQLLKEVLHNTDPTFLEWAIDKIVYWTNQEQPENIFHIHGAKDRILPLSFVNCDVIIKSAGHLMVLNKSEELNEVLLNQLPPQN